MGAKFALWEQTCPVVFGISGSGLPRQVSTTPVSLINLYPTRVALCGLPAPTTHTLDGINLTPVLKAERSERGKPVLSTYGFGNHSITDGVTETLSHHLSSMCFLCVRPNSSLRSR